MRRLGTFYCAVAVCAIAACSDATGPTPTPRTVQVTATGAFGPSGAATITDVSGANSMLSASLIGFDANTSHSVAILQGTCSAPGATTVTLANIDANSAGRATIASTAVADAAVTAGHTIVFYASTSSTSAIIACGDIT